MDAYKTENLSTELENVFQETSDIESENSSELESELTFEMLVDQTELQQQALEAEFADYTQQAASEMDSFSEFDLEIETATDSDRGMASNFTELNPDQLMETTHIDEIQSGFELEKIDPEPRDFQSEILSDVEMPHTPEESDKSDTSLKLEVAPELAMPSEIAVAPELELCSDTTKSDMEITPELAIPSELEAVSESEINAEISGQTDLEEPSQLKIAPEIERLSEEEIAPTFDKKAENAQTQAKDKIEKLEFQGFRDQAEFQQPQTLEAEFAHYNSQVTFSDVDNFCDSDLEINKETDSGRDTTSNFNELKPDQLLETEYIDGLQPELKLEKSDPESGDFQSDMTPDLEIPQALEESVKSDTSLELNVAPELAITSEIAVAPELELCVDTEKSETELTLELADIPEASIDFDSEEHSAPEVSPGETEISGLADMTELDIPSEIEVTPELSTTPDLEAGSESEITADSSDQTDLEEPSKLESAPEMERLSEEEITPTFDKEAENCQTQAKAKIDPLEFNALQTQTEKQGVLIAKLESEIITLKEQSQLDAENEIKLEDYQTLKVEVRQLSEQVLDWEQRYDILSQKLDQQTQLANNRIDPEVHETLNQKLQEYIDQVQSLQSEKDILEQSVQILQSQAEAKIERVEYEAVLEQLQHLKEKNSRNFWTRIMDWLKGD